MTDDHPLAAATAAALAAILLSIALFLTICYAGVWVDALIRHA